MPNGLLDLRLHMEVHERPASSMDYCVRLLFSLAPDPNTKKRKTKSKGVDSKQKISREKLY